VSIWEVAVVAGGVAAAVVVMLVAVLLARLVAAVASLDRSTRELGRAVDDLRAEAAPVGMAGGNGSVGSGVRSNGGVDGGADGGVDGGVGRVDHGASTSTRRANGRGRLPDLTLVSPVIKARALGRGTSLAARQLRQRREG
jgi:hypothetical protein